MKYIPAFLTCATLAASNLRGETSLDAGTPELNNPNLNVNARVVAYAPGCHGAEIHYNVPITPGGYSKEYKKIDPPADSDRKDKKIPEEKAIVLNRDTNDMTSEDFTKMDFQGSPAPLPVGTTIAVTKPANLNLYKANQSLVPDSELVYVVPATPGESDVWLKPLAAGGTTLAWARGTAPWHLQMGGLIKLTIKLPNDGRSDTAKLKLVPRRHVVIIAGGSSHNKDNAHAIEIRHSPPDVTPVTATIHLPRVLKEDLDVGPLFKIGSKLFDGINIESLTPGEREALRLAVRKVNILKPGHDNSHLNFIGVSCELAKQLVEEGCEVHLVVNKGAAQRRNAANTFPGLIYNVPSKPWIEKCVNYDKSGNTFTTIDAATTNFSAPVGKGKSNPYQDGADRLGAVISGISGRVKIDDVFYFGHSGAVPSDITNTNGTWYFEYGSIPSGPNQNDAWQDESGVNSGECRSSDHYQADAVATKATFNSGNQPRLYHCGCSGANPFAAKPFCKQAADEWGVTAKGCVAKTSYAGIKSESFTIPCDGTTISINIPRGPFDPKDAADGSYVSFQPSN